MSEAIQTIPKPPKVDPTHQTMEWIVSGNAPANILEAIAATFPKAKAREIFVAAVSRLEESGANPNVDLVRGIAMESYREIYRRAIEMGDLVTAIRAMRELVELAER